LYVKLRKKPVFEYSNIQVGDVNVG
jgi:hypothetical protein